MDKIEVPTLRFRALLLINPPKELPQFQNIWLYPILKWCLGLRVGRLYPSMVVQYLLLATILMLTVLINVHLDRNLYFFESLIQGIYCLCLLCNQHNISKTLIIQKKISTCVSIFLLYLSKQGVGINIGPKAILYELIPNSPMFPMQW